jgi:VWFA-related protein
MLSTVRLSGLLSIAAAMAVTLSAQQAQTPTFRTRTELVQVDVVVVDRRGNHVRGLRAEDFELFDRDQAQKVAAFDEVSHGRDEEAIDFSAAPDGWRLDVASNVGMQASRLVVLVIDDLHIYRRRNDRVKSLGREIVTSLGPDATMAVLFTSGKNSTQVTTDRSRLLAAIDTTSGNKAWPRPHSGMDSPGGSFSDGPSLNRDGAPIERRRSSSGGSMELQEFFENMSQFKTLQDAAKMLGAGDTRRKAFVMISEGIGKDMTGMFDTDGTTPCDAKCPMCPCFHDHALQNMMQGLWRSSVATYIIDPRGSVESQRLMAEEFPGSDADSPFRWNNVIRQAQEGLSFIAAASGGFAVTNTDDFAWGLSRIVSDLDHYYLLGFYPEDTKGKGFRRLDVKVRGRSDLTLRFRRGYQIVDSAKEQKAKNANPLVALSEGVLPRSDLAMKVAAIPLVASGQLTRVALALEVTAPVAALRDPDGRLRDNLKFHVLAAQVDKNKVSSVGGLEGRVTLSPSPNAGAAPVDVTYQVMDEIELRPGRYQLRVSATSNKLAKGGSVYLDVDVPDLGGRDGIGGFALGVVPARVPVVDLAEAGKGMASRIRRPRPQALPFAPTLARTFAPGDSLRVHAVLPQVADRGPTFAKATEGKPRAADRKTQGATIVIVDAAGTAAFSQDADSMSGRIDSTITLPGELRRGAYLFRVVASGGAIKHETGILVR